LRPIQRPAVSRTSARHRKPSGYSVPEDLGPSRHGKHALAASGPKPSPEPRRTPRLARPARLATVAGAALAVGIAAATAIASWPGAPTRSTLGQVDAAGRAPGGGARSVVAPQASDRLLAEVVAKAGLKVHALSPRPHASPSKPAAKPKPVRSQPRPKPRPTTPPPAPPPPPPVYLNPLRAIAGLIPERVDMGVDFGGAGPIYALGNAVITNATATSAGWPGGGWITYQLTDGPAAGLQVYVAEDVTPTVQVGEQVTSSTVIANMYNGAAGIETGWAMPDGSSAESQLAVAGGISGGGPFPTLIGLNFDDLLQVLGVPAAPNSGQAGFGLLPSNYPASWADIK